MVLAQGGDRTGVRLVRLARGIVLLCAPQRKRETSVATSGLTPAEWEVVDGALRGLCNGAIGSARGCSARTVANQLASAYAKLGISGRRELRARLRVASQPTPSEQAILAPPEHDHDWLRAAVIRSLEPAPTRFQLANDVGASAVSTTPSFVWEQVLQGHWRPLCHFELGVRLFVLLLQLSASMTRVQALSRREAEVWSLQAQGISNKHIAYSLNLSHASVVRNLARARQKLGEAAVVDALLAACGTPPLVR